MSGICGIVSLNNLKNYKIKDLNSMMDKIKHRGENNNYYVTQKAMLGQINDKKTNFITNKK